METAESEEVIKRRVERAFGRDARLRNRGQLQEMRDHGRKAVGKTCVVIALEAPPDGSRRAAFLISRKYSLLAVDRNRARRLFRETYRRLYERLPQVWLLFIPRHRIRDAKQDEVQLEVESLLAQLGITLETV